MSDPDSSSSKSGININPTIAGSVHPGPERSVYKYREYFRHPGIRAAQDPSVIWSLGEEYERNKERFWRCGICKKTTMLVIHRGISSALRHLRRCYKINKIGRRIRPRQTIIRDAISRTV
jgi:hypothetical protein